MKDHRERREFFHRSTVEPVGKYSTETSIIIGCNDYDGDDDQATMENLDGKIVRQVKTYCGESQIIKHLTTIFPGIRISIFLLNLVIESINLGDLSALMIASQESDLIRISERPRQISYTHTQ